MFPYRLSKKDNIESLSSKLVACKDDLLESLSMNVVSNRQLERLKDSLKGAQTICSQNKDRIRSLQKELDKYKKLYEELKEDTEFQKSLDNRSTNNDSVEEKIKEYKITEEQLCNCSFICLDGVVVKDRWGLSLLTVPAEYKKLSMYNIQVIIGVNGSILYN